MSERHILIILDGYGLAEDPSVSAVDRAEKPFLTELFESHPTGRLTASGEAVGLPDGQMGNSEVGHMNLGAGRVVYQEITRINRAISDGSFFENDVLTEAAGRARANDGTLHLLGLVSDGGVHSHIDHLFALLELAAREGLDRDQVAVHVFTDGRDTDPHGGVDYVARLEERMDEIGVGRVASVVGRYYAMDRDRRWERTERAYDLLVEGDGATFGDPMAALEDSYEQEVTDEFVEPRWIDHPVDLSVQDGDSVVFFNFRSDRARQLTRAFTEEEFDGFERGAPPDLYYGTFTPYEKEFDLPVAFPTLDLEHTLGETLAERGMRQLRVAETEKYAHVTYFFNGGREIPFDREDRILVDSPKVATYDLQPEMSAPAVADRVAEALSRETYELVVLNFANPDMVGHTGDFEAAVEAIEAVDAGSRRVITTARQHGYSVQVIADHGNADRMRNPDGSPHTAHTTALVPHCILAEGVEDPLPAGKLGDVAPTILALLDVPIPEEMDGNVLVE